MVTTVENSGLPLVLLPGMGADERIFEQQLAEFPNLVVPKWLRPDPDDTLPSYAAKMANSLRIDGPCVIGGASFGGLVALEMTRFLDCQGCILIGSIRGPHEMPATLKMLKSFAGVVDYLPIRCLQISAGWKRSGFSTFETWDAGGISQQFSDADPEVVRWSIEQLLKWDYVGSGAPVRQIHGDRDRIFPIKQLQPDSIVHRGGHVLSVTHGEQVNQFIHRCLEKEFCC